jgi:hypothetical protein
MWMDGSDASGVTIQSRIHDFGPWTRRGDEAKTMNQHATDRHPGIDPNDFWLTPAPAQAECFATDQEGVVGIDFGSDCSVSLPDRGVIVASADTAPANLVPRSDVEPSEPADNSVMVAALAILIGASVTTPLPRSSVTCW